MGKVSRNSVNPGIRLPCRHKEMHWKPRPLWQQESVVNFGMKRVEFSYNSEVIHNEHTVVIGLWISRFELFFQVKRCRWNDRVNLWVLVGKVITWLDVPEIHYWPKLWPLWNELIENHKKWSGKSLGTLLLKVLNFSFLMQWVDKILRSDSGYVSCSSYNLVYSEGFPFWNSKVIWRKFSSRY